MPTNGDIDNAQASNPSFPPPSPLSFHCGPPLEKHFSRQEHTKERYRRRRASLKDIELLYTISHELYDLSYPQYLFPARRRLDDPFFMDATTKEVTVPEVLSKSRKVASRMASTTREFCSHLPSIAQRNMSAGEKKEAVIRHYESLVGVNEDLVSTDNAIATLQNRFHSLVECTSVSEPPPSLLVDFQSPPKSNGGSVNATSAWARVRSAAAKISPRSLLPRLSVAKHSNNNMLNSTGLRGQHDLVAPYMSEDDPLMKCISAVDNFKDKFQVIHKIYAEIASYRDEIILTIEQTGNITQAQLDGIIRRELIEDVIPALEQYSRSLPDFLPLHISGDPRRVAMGRL